jgi:hypothetical protein
MDSLTLVAGGRDHRDGVISIRDRHRFAAPNAGEGGTQLILQLPHADSNPGHAASLDGGHIIRSCGYG